MDAASEQARLSVSGMTCATCAQRIEKVLMKTQGVHSAQVNLAGEIATVAFDPQHLDLQTLIKRVEGAGFGAIKAPSKEEERLALKKSQDDKARRQWWFFTIATALTLPLALPMALAPFGVHIMLPHWLQWLLATPVQFIFGARFYVGAYNALRSGSSTMDVLVALGTSAAYGLSLYNIAEGYPDVYFEAAAAVITLVMLGKLLEARAKHQTASAVDALLSLKPAQALLLPRLDAPLAEGVLVALDAVSRGQILAVRPGEKIPVDGEVVAGESEVDQSLLTGESHGVHVAVGDNVYGGAINGPGLLRIKATAVGDDAMLAKIIDAVETAQGKKAKIQTQVDKVSAIFVPTVVAIALITIGAWWFFDKPFEAAWMAGVAVLVVACPCALGLATPTALMVGTGRGAQLGILFRDADTLALAEHAQVVVFDKTGTLTEGKPKVMDTLRPPVSAGKSTLWDETQLWQHVASAQSASEHPLGQAMVAHAKDLGVSFQAVEEAQALIGKGLEAEVLGQRLLIGSARLMAERGVLDDTAAAEARAWAQTKQGLGQTVVWVASRAADDSTTYEIQALISLGDAPRADAKAAVKTLQDLGLKTVILTGDQEITARAVAAELGIDEVIAGLLPEDKAGHVASIRAAGQKVIMVGDGVNDAPALAEADVGVAMGSGTDVAIKTAGITLMRPELNLLADAIALSHAINKKIRANLFWAFAYNTGGIPLAALGILSPIYAGAAMALSSISVVSNALLLKRWQGKAG